MSTMTLPSKNGSAQGMTSAWLPSSVQEFFSAVNWDDRPLEPPTPEQTPQSTTGELSLEMTVTQFMEAVSWDGERVIAAFTPVDEPIAAEPPADEITLDDFSGLF